MKLSEATNSVVDLARKVREYYATELPKRHPNYPVVDLGELGVPPPREESALRDFLSRLPGEMVYQLLLVMYLGRGDVGVGDLAEFYETLKGTFTRAQDAVSQMMDKAPLADYLTDGLEELRKHNVSLDNLPLKKAKVRKR
jgi:hypothetical protein